MPSLPPGAYGENCGLAAQPHDHGHVMTPAVGTMIASRRIGLAQPRQRRSVAARVVPAIFAGVGSVVRHSSCLFKVTLLPSTIRTPLSASQSHPLTRVRCH